MSSAIAAMPISSTIEMSSAMQYRQTGSRSRSSHLNRHGNRRPSADDANLDNAGALEGLYSDNEDESFEVPDFHFDWGVAKEKTRTEMGSRVENNLEALTLSHLAVGETRRVPSAEMAIPRADTTPPPRPLQSAQSSSSSAHIMSLTDASTASASSMIPTPPNPNSATNSGALSSHGSESSASGGGHPGRMYGVRSFQRVVSAPLTRQRYEGERVVAANDDISVSASTSTQTHTATLRPPLIHTTSASSIRLDSSTSTSTRNQYVTPGLTERMLTSTAASTGRRLGGLSRFGGPARRVIPPPDTEETDGDDRFSPVLIESPRHDGNARASTSSPGESSRSTSPDTTGRNQHHRQSPPRGLDPPPVILDIVEPRPLMTRTFRHEPSQASAVTAQRKLSTSSPPGMGDRPFRPFQSRHNQENEPEYDEAEASMARRLKTVAPRSVTDVLDRPPPQPLRPAHVVHRVLEPPPPSQRTPPLPQALVATRAPPVLEQGNVENRSLTQTAPLVPQSSQYPGPDLGQQAATLPTQVVPPGKRSFLVNGMPYERVGVLGKGGSSKVYSVLCPTKRIVYALKRVALDRADSETYQSYTNEIDLLKRLRGHDRIIQLIDHQITFGQGNRPRMLMMVMECGEIDFATILDEQKGKPLNRNFVGLYWEQMLEAVHAVHLENVVHTDLKPANFVLVKGRLKIIDFGIAKAVANDTVNIQRDQQIGTVNYMSPEAIQRMNNQKVLKLSYPSDVWSLGCILYQMVYGNPPFAQIGGGPLPKMNAIADPSHRITYSDTAVPKPGISSDERSFGSDERSHDPSSSAVLVDPTAIDSMKRCLTYRKEQRLTIPELLQHEFLRPQAKASAVPQDSTFITRDQMAMLVNFVLREHGQRALSATDTTAEDLFSQLEAQNALT